LPEGCCQYGKPGDLFWIGEASVSVLFSRCWPQKIEATPISHLRESPEFGAFLDRADFLALLTELSPETFALLWEWRQ
jgi:hypothetical protein